MAAWWRERALLARFVADLLHDELRRGRRSDEGLPQPPWPEALRLDADLHADSLERMSLASALAEAVQLQRSGIEDALLVRRRFGEWLDVCEAGLARHDAALTFRTSGSTGAPRACHHDLDALEQEAGALAARLGPLRRLVRVVPAHHIYGFLFTSLLPARLALGQDAVIDARGSSPAGVARLLRPGDALVGHPDFWRAFVRSGARVAPGIVGITSTAPCPDDLARDVAHSGIGPLLQVYGASETAGIGWRTEPGQPFELMPFWRRVGAALVRVRPDGSEATAAPPDRLAWEDDRRFFVLARNDGAVQVGGVNVFPAQVRQALLEHSSVADAAVRLMRPGEGTRLKAFIVPAGGVVDLGALERSLRAWIDERLAPPERPKAMCFGPALPTTDTGKLADWQLDDNARLAVAGDSD